MKCNKYKDEKCSYRVDGECKFGARLKQLSDCYLDRKYKVPVLSTSK